MKRGLLFVFLVVVSLIIAVEVKAFTVSPSCDDCRLYGLCKGSYVMANVGTASGITAPVYGILLKAKMEKADKDNPQSENDAATNWDITKLNYQINHPDTNHENVTKTETKLTIPYIVNSDVLIWQDDDRTMLGETVSFDGFTLKTGFSSATSDEMKPEEQSDERNFSNSEEYTPGYPVTSFGKPDRTSTGLGSSSSSFFFCYAKNGECGDNLKYINATRRLKDISFSNFKITGAFKTSDDKVCFGAYFAVFDALDTKATLLKPRYFNISTHSWVDCKSPIPDCKADSPQFTVQQHIVYLGDTRFDKIKASYPDNSGTVASYDALGNFSSYVPVENGDFSMEGTYRWCWPIVKTSLSDTTGACLHLQDAYTVDWDKNESMCENAPKTGAGDESWKFAWLQTGNVKAAGKCAGDDAIINPGFEITNAEDPVVFGWVTPINTIDKTGCGTSPGDCGIAASGHTGSHSYWMTGANKQLAIKNPISCTDNCKLSFWAKTLDSSGTDVCTSYPKTTGSTTSTVAICNNIDSGTNEWKHYLIDLSDGDNNQITIFFNKLAAGAGTVWIDDVQVINGQIDISGNNNWQSSDLGNVTTDNAGVKNIAYFDGSAWKWLDAMNSAFAIKTADGSDIISNSVDWYQCNQNFGISPAKISPFNILPFPNAGTISTVAVATGAGGGYSLGDAVSTAFIPADNFANGLTVVNASTKSGSTGGPAGISSGTPYETFPSDLNNNQFVSQRFICSNHDDMNILTECCGYSLSQCKNTIQSKIRRTGNVLSSIWEFPHAADNTNYALLFGLPWSPPTDYNLPLVTDLADNPIYNWSNYSYLDFFINYAIAPVKADKTTSYLHLVVLSEVPSKYSITNYTAGITTTDGKKLGNYLLANILIDQSVIVNQDEAQKWLHVKILLNSSCSDKTKCILKSKLIKHISFYATQSEVPQTFEVAHSALDNGNTYFRNIFAIDRIFLSKVTDDTQYCAAFPLSQPTVDTNVGHVWMVNSYINNKKYNDTLGLPIGRIICDSTPGWKWTGATCCGDNVNWNKALNRGFAESYTDTKGGCIQGRPVMNDTLVNVTYTSGGQTKKSDLYFLNIPRPAEVASPDGYFYTCGESNQITYISNTFGIARIKDATQSPEFSTTGQASYSNLGYCLPNITGIGSYYCEIADNNWHRKSEMSGQNISSKFTFLTVANPYLPTYQYQYWSKCCPQNWCALNSTFCAPDQSTNYGLTGAGMPWNYSTALAPNGASYTPKCSGSAASCPYNSYSGTFVCNDGSNPTCEKGSPVCLNGYPYCGIWGRGSSTFTFGTGTNVINFPSMRCIKGKWQTAIAKWNPDHTEQGYCDNQTKCYLDSTNGCVNAGFYKGDDYCGINAATHIDGNWTTRTRLIALRLAKLAPSDHYTIYCDSYNNVLNEYNYLLSWDQTTNANKIILGDSSGITYSCAGTSMPCSNNFCILRYTDNKGEHVVVGTSLNLPVNTQSKEYSFLRLFNEANSTNTSHHDFCDQAISDAMAAPDKNVYKACNGGIQIPTPVQTPGTGKIWYNNYTQSIIYSKDKITIDMGAPTNSWLLSVWSNIISWLGWGTTPSSYSFISEISDTNRIYIAQESTSQINGIVEQVGANQVMTVNYVKVMNICTDSAVKNLLHISTFYVNQCNPATNGGSYITKDPEIISEYWNELTTKTRLQ